MGKLTLVMTLGPTVTSCDRMTSHHKKSYHYKIGPLLLEFPKTSNKSEPLGKGRVALAIFSNSLLEALISIFNYHQLLHIIGEK